MLDISMLSRRYAVRKMTEEDTEDLLAFCSRNTLYYRYCGAEATIETVRDDLRVTPPGVCPRDKYYVGFFDGPELVAVMDLIDGYPEPDRGFIGFFMMNADLQGKGIGTGIVDDVCACLKREGKTGVRLAFAEGNPQAGHFWRKNGFRVAGRAPMDGWTALVADRAL